MPYAAGYGDNKDIIESFGCRGNRCSIIYKGGSDHAPVQEQRNTHPDYRSSEVDLPFFVRTCVLSRSGTTGIDIKKTSEKERIIL